ncbi:MAG TPA: IS110 family transposase [Actinomycetota bacterium]|nr:IS110 family transposase [Actinomycetota bacterium]
MFVIGVDAHKRTHTLGVVDEVGRALETRTFPATVDGHSAALRWAQRWPERMFAVEDCRHLTRQLEADLIRAGEAVMRVPPRLMAEARRTGRELGKSDPIDALAAARAALREPGLPVARLDGEPRRLRLLVDHREDLVGERTRMQSRLRWHLHELFPGLEIAPKSLGRLHVIAALDRRLHEVDGTVAAIARELLVRIRELTERINELEREITTLVRPLASSLLAMPGCGPLSAAKILGEVAGASRFRSKAAFARWNGTAPIPVWSGNDSRHRLNRGGNRQVNAALHRIALTQWRGVGPGQAYVQHRLTAGSTKTEALRLLRRRLSDEVFRRLRADETTSAKATTTEEVVAA